MEMTGALFDNIINTAQDCVFWKDKDRRFVGVNQAFLDFYGFESADVLIGKTDEDMGWHNDPEPFKQDELRVLAGHATYKVAGKCMIRGEDRDIIATKRPIYENGEIVGLVGSFMDVTDVTKRQKMHDKNQVMYTTAELRKFQYFDKLLDELPIEELLDTLTGIVSRKYAIGFAHSMIAAGTPFTFAIVDLDNFKYINDSFGHHTGDMVLEEVSRKLAEYIGEDGIAGRFGGDELLIINKKVIEPADKQDFFERLYGDADVLRSHITVEDHDLFMTGTVGCATFPADSDSYEDLFSKIDRTLYHGKNQGRNCFVIYDEAAHRDLDMKKLVKQGVYTNMNSLMVQLGQVNGFENRLRAAMSLIQDQFHIADMYYVGHSGHMHSVIDRKVNEDVSDIDRVIDDEILKVSNLEEISETSPKLYKALRKHNTGSALIIKIGLNMETDGYLVCADQRNNRLWQEDECGILYFIAKSLAAHIRLNKDSMPE